MAAKKKKAAKKKSARTRNRAPRAQSPNASTYAPDATPSVPAPVSDYGHRGGHSKPQGVLEPRGQGNG